MTETSAADRELLTSRVMDAPRQRVFRAFGGAPRIGRIRR